MKFFASWKLSGALAVVALLAAFAAWPGGPQDAEAALSPISANSMVGSDGMAISFTISGDDDNGQLSVTK